MIKYNLENSELEEYTSHAASASVHFTEGSIDHTNIQSIGTATHDVIDHKIGQYNAHAASASVHFTEASIDHGSISGLEDDDHPQYMTDTIYNAHAASASVHFTEASIDHGSISGLEDDDHPQYMTDTIYNAHAASASVHFTEASIDHGSIAGLEDDDHPQYMTDTIYNAHAASASVHFTEASIVHDNLSAVDSGTYRHLSAGQVTDLTDGGDTTLHDHDGISENTGARHTQGTDTTLGTMTADIDMDNSYQVVNLQAPANAGEALRQTVNITEADLEQLTDGSDTTLHDHDGISENTTARHAESHTITSHNDVTDATGANLEELTGGGDTTLHDHDGISENTGARHAESHNIASHNDTTATGAELNTLTDNSVANTLHRHSELVASDGAPDPAFSINATGYATFPAGTGINEFSIDDTLGGNSDNAVPTEKAVKTYVDAIGGGAGGLAWELIAANDTAAADEGFLINASGGDVTLTLPADPSEGDTVGACDVYNMATTNVITIGRNAKNIEGAANDLVIDVDGAGFILVYCDATRGWEIVSEISSGAGVADTYKSYDTGWINRSDWTDAHLGSNTTKNTDSNVTHNLDTPLSELVVKFMVSTDGTDNNSFQIEPVSSGAGDSRGYAIYQVDADNLLVQTGDNGIFYIGSDGAATILDNEDWYYKITVFKNRSFGTPVPDTTTSSDLSRPVFTYKDADEIYIGGGAYYHKGTSNQRLYWTEELTKSIAGAAVDTWYYLYIDDSAVVALGGKHLTEAELLWSDTPPTYSHSKYGRYNGDDKCIFAMLTDGSGNWIGFYHDGARFVEYDAQIQDLNNEDVDTVFIEVPLTAPNLGDNAQVQVTFYMNHNNQTIFGYYRKKGSSATTNIFGRVKAASEYNTSSRRVTVDSSQIIEVAFDTAGNDVLNVYTDGFYLPAGM
jgi:hypothetical protein